MLIKILVIAIFIAFNLGMIIGIKVRKIDKNKCKVIYIKSHFDRNRDKVIKKLNK